MRRFWAYLILFTICLVIGSVDVYAQQAQTKFDSIDISGAGTRDSEKKTMFLVFPNLSYNPVNGALFGVAGSTGFFAGKRDITRVSNVGFNLSYTTNRQFIFFVKSNVYTQGDRFFLQGDWRFLIYNAYTWGLGTNAPDSIESPDTWLWQGAQANEINNGFLLNYNYIKFHEVLNYKLKEYHYIGLGYHLDHYGDIRDDALQIEQQPFDLTPHYLYSRTYGFDTDKYTLSGLSLSYVFDSRDNLINAYDGYFVNVNYRYNPTILGSSQTSSSLWLEFRTYLPIADEISRHVLGFWHFSNFQITGRQPYLTLMGLGEDQRAKSGRGYVTGRYRGENLMYGEVEYRFPITQKSDLLGGVVFLNATTASNDSRNVSLFDYVRPGVGFGLRLLINESFRTNISLDFGLGFESRGFYFSGTETF